MKADQGACVCTPANKRHRLEEDYSATTARLLRRARLLAQQETMSVAAAVSVGSHDVASRVDPGRVGESGSRYIDGGKLLLRGQPNRDW